MLPTTLAHRLRLLMQCVSPNGRSWVLMLLGLRPLVLTLCIRRPWLLILLGLCLLVVSTYRLWVPVLSGLRRPTLLTRLVHS